MPFSEVEPYRILPLAIGPKNQVLQREEVATQEYNGHVVSIFWKILAKVADFLRRMPKQLTRSFLRHRVT